MLPQIHLKCNDKGYIVLHPHIHCVTNGIKLDIIRIRVIRPIDRIVQGQGPLLVLRISKNKLEQSVLIILLCVLQAVILYKNSVFFILLRQTRNGFLHLLDFPAQNLFNCHLKPRPSAGFVRKPNPFRSGFLLHLHYNRFS